jgi:hypothetical protein
MSLNSEQTDLVNRGIQAKDPFDISACFSAAMRWSGANFWNIVLGYLIWIVAVLVLEVTYKQDVTERSRLQKTFGLRIAPSSGSFTSFASGRTPRIRCSTKDWAPATGGHLQPFACRTLVYKGMLLTEQVEKYSPPLT